MAGFTVSRNRKAGWSAGLVWPWANRVIIRVTIKQINNLYAQRVKTDVFKAITAAMGESRAKGAEWAKNYWPRQSGHYMDDMLGTMRLEAYSEDPWVIMIGAEDTTYAGFVNRMHGVNWGSSGGNKNAVADAQGLIIMFMRQQVKMLVRQAVINAASYAVYQQQVSVQSA